MGTDVETSDRTGPTNDRRSTTVKIAKDQILDLLRSQGDDSKAEQADRELPGEVDTDQHGDLLSKFGIDIGDLLSKFGGGGGLGKLLG
jgi:hypothetical protein